MNIHVVDVVSHYIIGHCLAIQLLTNACSNTTQKQNNKKHNTNLVHQSSTSIPNSFTATFTSSLTFFSYLYNNLQSPPHFLHQSFNLSSFLSTGSSHNQIHHHKKRFNFLNVLFGLIPCVDTL
jgi:hypothetical protein